MDNIKTPQQIISSLLDKGLTQRQIAETAKVEASAISRIFKGDQTDMMYMPCKRIELLDTKIRRRKK